MSHYCCHYHSILLLVGETPDENDLFPSTPLDEEQLQRYNAQVLLPKVYSYEIIVHFSQEELGSVVINQINEGDQELAWSDIPWSDPR